MIASDYSSSDRHALDLVHFWPIRLCWTSSTDGGAAEETFGILELGGASTQIAFLPRGNILADKFPVQIGSHIYPLYVHSYLYYGQNYVDKWIKEQLYLNNSDSFIIDNPCMLSGRWFFCSNIINLEMSEGKEVDIVNC